MRKPALFLTENVLGATDAARGFYSGHDARVSRRRPREALALAA
jgi:hypothetical protein